MDAWIIATVKARVDLDLLRKDVVLNQAPPPKNVALQLTQGRPPKATDSNI